MNQESLDALIISQFGEDYVGAIDTSHFVRVKGNTSVRFMHGGDVWVMSREAGKFYLTKL